ncbi:MAG TPA: PQQ-dependent sugar dehydrogenase [Acidimicrobiia bacterium]|nr:PQQ-dependent sugar dehydrogenase [Acidimicrobiia bacterium]
MACTIAVLAVASSLAGSTTTSAGAAAPELRLSQVTDVPGVTGIAARTGTRTLYLAQQNGVVRSLRKGRLASAPAIDLRDRVSQDGGERGLLGIAFSPDGALLYLHYSDTDGDTQVDQYAMRGRNADPGSRKSILQAGQPAPNHNGGQLAFGPDGYLYLGLGDGGGAGDTGPGHLPGGNGQSLRTKLGKILRIAPDPAPGRPGYSVPADNPFVDASDADTAIWAYGLRNPWRFSFDRATGDLWIGDVGQNEYEEIDHVAATNGRDAGKGDNFGWDHLEGNHVLQGNAPADAVAPVHEITHDTGACAVVGGFVYRGTKIPGLVGGYLFSDNCDGTIRLLVADGAGVREADSGLEASSVSSFGQSNDGTLYVASLSDGIYRIDAG